MIEQICTGKITQQSSTITAAIYTITTGISSTQEWQFAFSILSSLVFSALFGFVIFIAQPQFADNPEMLLPQNNIFIKFGPFFGIAFISLLHGFERFNRHVADNEPYWHFSKEKVGEKL